MATVIQTAIGLSAQNQETGFKVGGGTTTKKEVSFSANATIDQDLATTASPTFAGATIGTDSGLANLTSGVVGAIADGTEGQVLKMGAGGPEWGTSGKTFTEKNEAYTLVNGDKIITYGTSARVNLTLPTTLTTGDEFRIAGRGEYGWKLSSNAGQTIYVGNQQAVTGATGYIQSTDSRDAVHVVCITGGENAEVSVFVEGGSVEIYQGE